MTRLTRAAGSCGRILRREVAWGKRFCSTGAQVKRTSLVRLYLFLRALRQRETQCRPFQVEVGQAFRASTEIPNLTSSTRDRSLGEAHDTGSVLREDFFEHQRMHVHVEERPTEPVDDRRAPPQALFARSCRLRGPGTGGIMAADKS